MNSSRQNPSPRYVQLIEQYRLLHREGSPLKGVSPQDTFAGYSLPRQAVRVRGLIVKTGAQTVLDYGSGKGAQYEADNIRRYWGVSAIRCYDPGYEPFAQLPRGKFDAVVCTDVLEHCPEEDLGWIVDELFAFAERFVFANVACFPALKTLPNGENAHCTVRPVAYWCALFAAAAARFPGVAWEIWADVKEAAGYVEVRCGS